MDINEEADNILRQDHEARLAEVRAIRERFGFPTRPRIERTPEEEEAYRVEFEADMDSLKRAVTQDELRSRLFAIYWRNKERSKREETTEQGVD